jgi:DNA-binding transcriptional LysR family regulator
VELRHLRYFVAVAEERHFGRAARRLEMAQPPLSRQIQGLEAELGFPLFDRSHRKVELTTAGDTFLAHTRRVFEALDTGVTAAKRAAAGKSGRITIAYPSSVAFSALHELFRVFHRRLPDVDVALRELPPQEQIEALKDGRIDVGFIRGPMNDEELSTKKVLSESLVIALPTNHVLTGKKRIALEVLAREPFICFPRHRGPGFFDYLMRLCHEAGFSPNILQEAPQLDIVSLVAAGFGVAIVPRSVKYARRPGVVFRPIVGSPKTEVHMAWLPSNGSTVLRTFLDILSEVGI